MFAQFMIKSGHFTGSDIGQACLISRWCVTFQPVLVSASCKSKLLLPLTRRTALHCTDDVVFYHSLITTVDGKSMPVSVYQRHCFKVINYTTLAIWVNIFLIKQQFGK